MMECHYTESRIVRLQQSSTRNSAVAECLSVVSFNSTIPRAQSLISLLITPASDLSTRAIKLCSVVFGVTSSYSVINKIHWCVARRRLFIAGYGRRISAITYPPPSKCWRHATVQPWSMPKSDISRKSPVFAPVRGSMSYYCHNIWYLPGYLPGVATPVLLKYLCSHRVSRTSVLEETHPRLFQSLQTILESVHGTCIHCVMIQTVPSVD